MAGQALADKPEMANAMAVLRASGLTQAEIADRLHVGRSTVAENLQRIEVRQRLELAQKHLANAALDNALDNVTKLVRDYEVLPDGQTKDHAFKATLKVLETMGVTPAHTQSLFVQHVYNQVNVSLSPVVREVVSRVVGELEAPPEDDEPIDV